MANDNGIVAKEDIDIPVMPEDEYQKVLEGQKERQMPEAYRYGMDGYIAVGHKDIKYRGIPYRITLLRYYAFNDPDAKLNDTGIHAVIDHPDVSREIMHIVDTIYQYREFLYGDTLRAGMEHFTIQEHINEAQKEAEGDIDWLLDDATPELEKRISEYKRIIKELKSMKKSEVK